LTNVLTRKASADDVSFSESEFTFAHVVGTGDIGPMLGEDAPGERINLAESDCTEASGALESKAEVSKAAEEIKYPHS
jgi:hypothetical protein